MLSPRGSFGRPQPQTQQAQPQPDAQGAPDDMGAQPEAEGAVADGAEPVGDYDPAEEANEPPEIQYLEELLGVEIPEHLWEKIASVLKTGKSGQEAGKAVEITKVRQEAIPPQAAKAVFRGFNSGNTSKGIPDLLGVKA